MANLQSTYLAQHARWIEGMALDMEPSVDISRVVQPSGGIGFGKVVIRGTADNQIALPAAGTRTGVSAAKTGGNTGNGTLVMDATTPVKPIAKSGIYTVRAVNAATNGGTFNVVNPDGEVVGTFTITPGAGASVTFDGEVKFVVTDGGTDFALSDGFDITVVNTFPAPLGITLLDSSQLQDSYAQYATAVVRTKGVVVVQASVAVNQGDFVYFVPSTGALTNVSNAGANVAIPLARWETTTSGAGLAAVRLG